MVYPSTRQGTVSSFQGRQRLVQSVSSFVFWGVTTLLFTKKVHPYFRVNWVIQEGSSGPHLRSKLSRYSALRTEQIQSNYSFRRMKNLKDGQKERPAQKRRKKEGLVCQHTPSTPTGTQLYPCRLVPAALCTRNPKLGLGCCTCYFAVALDQRHHPFNPPSSPPRRSIPEQTDNDPRITSRIA